MWSTPIQIGVLTSAERSTNSVTRAPLTRDSNFLDYSDRSQNSPFAGGDHLVPKISAAHPQPPPVSKLQITSTTRTGGGHKIFFAFALGGTAALRSGTFLTCGAP